MNLISSEATTLSAPRDYLSPAARETLCCTLLMRATSSEAAAQGLHLLSFGAVHLHFHGLSSKFLTKNTVHPELSEHLHWVCMYMYMYILFCIA